MVRPLSASGGSARIPLSGTSCLSATGAWCEGLLPVMRKAYTLNYPLASRQFRCTDRNSLIPNALLVKRAPSLWEHLRLPGGYWINGIV